MDSLLSWPLVRPVACWWLRPKVRRLMAGARAGDLVDAFNLALLFERVGNRVAAVSWYEQCADAGDVDAMCNLGLLFDRAGRKRDALAWFGAGAALGDSDCAYNAGVVCEELGEPAGEWFELASRLGDRDAVRWLRGRRV